MNTFFQILTTVKAVKDWGRVAVLLGLFVCYAVAAIFSIDVRDQVTADPGAVNLFVAGSSLASFLVRIVSLVAIPIFALLDSRASLVPAIICAVGGVAMFIAGLNWLAVYFGVSAMLCLLTTWLCLVKSAPDVEERQLSTAPTPKR